MDVMKIAEKAELVYHDKYGGYLSRYMEETDLEPYVRKFAKELLEEVAKHFDDMSATHTGFYKIYEPQIIIREFLTNLHNN